MRSVGSWQELLDHLEEELEGATPSEPFLAPSHLGPVPAELRARAARVQERIASNKGELRAAMATLRQEIALLPAREPDAAQFFDTLA
jgi:hypothetical protein